jgi:hypothetical protein
LALFSPQPPVGDKRIVVNIFIPPQLPLWGLGGYYSDFKLLTGFINAALIA